MSQRRALEVSEENGSNKRVRNAELIGKVVLMKKKLLDADDPIASWKDWWDEVKHNKISFQLVSADCQDSENEFRAKLRKVAFLQNWNSTKAPLTAAEVHFDIKFEWSHDFGVPGAFKVMNNHHNEFYLRSLTLEDVPEHGEVHFVCNSWVYPYEKYNYGRIFFSNKTYLPSATPEALSKYRVDELKHLRGNGEGELKEWDRVYDYAVYNDLGNPDRGLKYKRPTLGGSSDLPYPRRGRTSRPPAKKDPECESRIPILKSLEIYVPRDERFSPVKMSDAIAYGAKAAGPFIRAEIDGIDCTLNEFDSIDDMLKIYSISPLNLPGRHLLEQIKQFVPFEVLEEFLRRDGAPLKFPVPQVIEKNPSAWRTDEEFTREMLAGINPVVIRRLEEFPPMSKLDPEVYGSQTSKITKELIERCHKGLNVDEALENNKLFILDHHDTLMPFLRRINDNTSTKTYATRTILLLKDDGTLKPLAIELSLPDPRGDHFGPVSEVHLPAEDGVEASIWQLAKAYVTVNDSGVHQIISHWLRTHAAMEPFIIATHRQLSVLHPIYKLLHPHFRDTMHINALARQILINAGGAVENTVFPGEYSMEMSSVYYRNWVFTEQALPADLTKRGIAVGNGKTPGDVHLLIEDYPFAVDGLKIWFSIKTWVHNYCSFYYKNDGMLQNDSELHDWWNEIRTKGHGDKKNEHWWPKMQTLDELVESCTTIIWLASAYHAAINFGQYPFGGYMANRPSLSRRLIPQPGTAEYEELKASPEKTFLKTITAEFQTLLGISLIEILSIHTADEVYLGHREKGWTTDGKPLEDFKKFSESLEEIESKILEMNANETLHNRTGPAEMPYTLLVPSSDIGLTGRGIPNSISI